MSDVKNHSFFFVDARINPDIEANCTATTHGSYITSSKDATADDGRHSAAIFGRRRGANTSMLHR